MVTALCSVTTTGLVFLAGRRLKIGSDVTLTVQTSTPGAVQDWTVQGWVVECRTRRPLQAGLRYQITLLFSVIPAELEAMLANQGKVTPTIYPACDAAGIFGLN